MKNELTPEQTEYVPDDLLFNFISKSLPGIKVVKMKLPVDADENGTEMYVSKAQLIGVESDGEQKIANKCLEFLAQEIEKTGHKKIGIYKLLKNPEVEISKSPSIILRYAFPQPTEISDVEDPYEPKYTKSIKPFNYDQKELLNRIEGNDNE